MRVWGGYKDADEAVETITKVMKENGKLPDVLIDSYRRSLAYGYHGVTQRFYGGLAEKCPEALKYFADVEKEKS
jgi:hypothetical protein